MLARYLQLTVSRKAEANTASNYVELALIALGLLLTGAIFWVLGQFGVANTSFAPFFIVGFIGLGLWVGLRYVSAHQPNGYYFLSKDVWLWGEAFKGKLLALIIAASTVLPYYLANSVGLSPRLILLWVVVLLSIAVTCTFFGELVAITIRRACNSALVRFTLLITTGFALLAIIISQSTSIHQAEIQLFANPTTSVLLPALLFFAGCGVILALLLELVFSSITLTSHSARAFWGSNRAVNVFRFTNKPFTEALVSSGLYVLRSSAFQRRLLVVLAMFFVWPIVSFFVATGTNYDSAVFGSLAALVLAVVYAPALGSFASTERQTLASLPQASKLHSLAEYMTGGVLLIALSTIFANILVPFPGVAATVVMVTTTLCSFTLLFFASYYATIKLVGQSAIGGLFLYATTLAIGSAVSVGIMAPTLICLLLVLWTLLALWLLRRAAQHHQV